MSLENRRARSILVLHQTCVFNFLPLLWMQNLFTTIKFSIIYFKIVRWTSYIGDEHRFAVYHIVSVT